MNRPKIERSVCMEVHAMNHIVEQLYQEREYLEFAITANDRLGDEEGTEKAWNQLQIIEHFIKMYEEY